MKNKKEIRLLLVGASLVMLLLAYYAGSSYYHHLFMEETENIVSGKEYEYQFEMIVESPNSGFWQAVYEYAQQAAEEENTLLEMKGAEWGEEYNKIDFMEMSIASGVDGIILEYNGEEGLEEKINEAVEQGIPVVTIMGDAAYSMRQSFVGVSDYQMAIAYGGEVAKFVDNNTREIMVLMKKNEHSTNHNQICTQIENMAINKINREHEIHVESKNFLSFGSFEIEEAVRDIFQGTAGPPDILVCMDEEVTECARQALIDYNMAGLVKIIGYYISDNILDAVEKGLISETCHVDTRQLGEYSVKALKEYLVEGRVSSYYNVDIDFLDVSDVRARKRKEAINEND